MSILNKRSAETPKSIETADTIIEITNSLYRAGRRNWEAAMELLWNPPAGVSTQDILDVFGTDAAIIFQLSHGFAQILEAADSGSTAAALSKMKPFTVNPDGTITLD